MATQEQRAAMLAKLDEIEAEMKAIGFWMADPPSAGRSVEIGMAPWLQGVFLPNARARVRDDDLPDKSMVGVMAMREYDYMGTVEEALPLVTLLHEFDRLILDARD